MKSTVVITCTSIGKNFIHYDDYPTQTGKSPLYTLETARLWLRPIQESDAEGLHEVMTVDSVMKYWYRGPYTKLSQTQAFIRSSLDSHYHFAIFLKSTSPPKLIGRITLVDDFIGYMLHPSVWGQGFASEAIKAYIDYIWEVRPELRFINADVDPRNNASLALLGKSGFVKTGSAENTFLTHIGWCGSVYLRLERLAAGNKE